LVAATDAAMVRWAESSMAWGTDDCLMALADIYRDALGCDPGERWRGRYDTEAGAILLMGKRGVPGLAGRAARTMGWKRIAVERALPGDFGVAMTATGRPAGVIRHRKGWVGRIDHGFSVSMDGTILTAWRVR
jgi:hypothetical protein